jgi:MFS family permease
LLLEGALISSTGDFMQNVAQSWLVWELTRSPLALGVVGLFDTVPRLIFGAVGGAIADRFDRRRILMITQSLAMAQAILYWLAVYLNVILFWHVCILAFFLGAVNTINQTARQSLVNSLIPKEDLLNAIGLQSSVFNFSKIVGPSAGGVIISLVGVAGCFFVNALSFVALLFNLHLMELPAWEERAQQKGMWNDIKEGYSYLRNNRTLYYIVALSYVLALFGAPYNRFLPMFATNILHVGPSGFGLLMSAPGMGATVAALFLASVKSLRVGIPWISSCVLGFGIALALFALSHSFILSFFLLCMVGFWHIAARALSNTLIQVETPSNLLGRVLSLFFMDRGLWSMGSVLIGSLASVMGIAGSLTACASVCALAAGSLLLTAIRQPIKIVQRRQQPVEDVESEMM